LGAWAECSVRQLLGAFPRIEETFEGCPVIDAYQEVTHPDRDLAMAGAG
jgi:hypothetical protein